MTAASGPTGSPGILHYMSLLPSLLRGWIYFLLRLRLPRLVLMERGARIRGLSNIVFEGPAKIGAFSLVDARHCAWLRLGRNFSLGSFSILRCSGSPSFLCPGVTIGDDVTFGPYCNIGGGFGVTIADANIFGPYVSIHPESHVTESRDVPIRRQGVTGTGIAIGTDNWFGAKVTVLDGSRIGSGNILAAGAVFAGGEYGGESVYGGVPAKFLGPRQ